MLPKSNSSLIPSPNNTFYNQTLSPTYYHYASTPNVVFYFDDQVCMNIHLKL
jgi:hypothetical protein